MAISDNSGIEYVLSLISWYLSFITGTVEYCAADIEMITHCHPLLS